MIRDLLADDPADRPSASEARERLAAQAPRAASAISSASSTSFDDTGDWTAPGSSGASTTNATMDGPHGPRALVLDAGPARLGPYRLLDKLGEGGQGVVYRAEHPDEGAIVAIKILRTDRSDHAMALRRFRKEARLQAAANNPHVVNLLEYNEEDGIPYLVLEFVSGEGLDRLLRRRGRLEEREALAIMAGVARAR